MGHRPAPLDLNGERGDDNDLRPPRFPNFHMDLPSPRAGETPPALSPLDQFALHSRLLARRFDQEAEAGRRISRIPHGTVAQELATRPSYFSRPSNSSADDGNMSDIAESPYDEASKSGYTPDRKDGLRNRPLSQYPTRGRVSRLAGNVDRSSTPYYDAPEDRTPTPASDYFAMARDTSPEAIDPRVNVEAPSPNPPSLTNSVESLSSTTLPTRNPSDQASRIHAPERNLLPLRSPHIPKSPRSLQSIRPVRQDSGDDDNASSIAPTSTSSRKLSGSSGMSMPQSPFTPSFTHHAHRSPSMTSEYSLGGFSHSPRPPTMNFSRPDRPMSPEINSMRTRQSEDSRRSLDSRPSVEIAVRPATNGSIQQTPPRKEQAFDLVPKPFANEDNASDSEASEGKTYTYAKFTLPRGRGIERNSLGFRTSWIEKQFNWDDEEAGSNPLVQPVIAHAHGRKSSDVLARQFAPTLPTVDSRPQTSYSNDLAPPELPFLRRPASAAAMENLALPSMPILNRPSSTASLDNIPSPSRPFAFLRPSTPPAVRSQVAPSFEVMRGRHHTFNHTHRSHSADTRGGVRQKSLHTPSASIATDSTERTIMPLPLHQQELSSEVTPEDHLEIGIQAHNAGALNKSTYHLRLAANAGLPTAMLLYALACRHGWGMKHNQEEGVKWLRKAIDTAKLDENTVDQTLTAVSRRSGILDLATEAAERKRRKAQFSLAIYELGMSYMKGWGCPKDRTLALRCYEIAGNWGDCDALAEAGFCYTQGLGCKKDMHKAAILYRKAADLGVPMTGHSWIYKDKYMHATEPSKKSMDSTVPIPEPRDSTKRARSRSIWGRPKKER